MSEKIARRQFLGSALAVAGAVGLNRALADDTPASSMAAPGDIPIIDCHIHLFDPTRPQGVPWPAKNNAILYKPALPSRYRDVIKGFGIVGAIEIECSTWLEDNQWVLDVSDKDTIMVGTIGNLEPGKAEFAQQLERFHKNPLFRGIRYGNLWGRDLGAELSKPQFIADLKLLANAGLVLDTANPNLKLLADVARLTDLVPELRIVIDHLPSLPRPTDSIQYDQSMKQLGQRPQVYVKVSEVLRHGADGKVAYDLASYRATLDQIYETFGPDRLLFGSDWPNSDPFGTYSQVLSIVREYFTSKGHDVAEKYFWKNSIAAYRWIKRDAAQPQPS